MLQLSQSDCQVQSLHDRRHQIQSKSIYNVFCSLSQSTIKAALLPQQASRLIKQCHAQCCGSKLQNASTVQLSGAPVMVEQLSTGFAGLCFLLLFLPLVFSAMAFLHAALPCSTAVWHLAKHANQPLVPLSLINHMGQPDSGLFYCLYAHSGTQLG